MEPSAALATYRNALSSTRIFSYSISCESLPAMVSMLILWKSYRWHLESIVIGILLASVVASMNITYSGGSSSVFNNALNAPMESI